MRRLTPYVPALLLLAALTGCQSPESGPQADQERQVVSALKGYEEALSQGQPEAIRACFTEDIDYLEGSDLRLKGPDAVLKGFATLNFKIVKAGFTPLATLRDGDLVRQTGLIRHRIEFPKGNRAWGEGRFEALWVQAPDGRWRIRRWETAPAQ